MQQEDQAYEAVEQAQGEAMRRALYDVALSGSERVLAGALIALGLGYVVGTYAEGLRR